jgi:hypothetical protein
LLVLAGFGIKAFWEDCATAAFKQTYFRVLTGLAILLALFLGTTEAVQRSTYPLGGHISKSPFFWGYSALLVASLALVPWFGRQAIQARPRIHPWSTLSLGVIFVLLHWRHGMHLTSPFDPYVMNPQERTKLTADGSPALALINSRSPEPFRTAGLGYDFFPGYGQVRGLEQIDGPDPLLNRYYKSLIDTSGLKLFFGSSRGSLFGEKLGNDLPLLDLLNVRYFLGSDPDNPELAPSVKKIASLDLEVYESQKVWPRAFFVNRAVPYASDADFVRLLHEGDGKPFAAITRGELKNRPEIEPLVAAPDQADRQIIPATGYSLTSNNTSYKIKAPGPGIVVLTEPYLGEDLTVQVNGKAVRYFRVNSAFRGVFIPEAGEYQFSFAYWPRHLTAALGLSAIGIVLLAAWLRLTVRYSERGA